MASGRRPLWDQGKQDLYWSARGRAEQRAAERQDGVAAARDLEALWAGLDPEERAVMEYLLLSGQRSAVARHEDPALDRLLGKGLLQVPPGVGTLLMRKMETIFTVPGAVWRELTARKSALLPGGPAEEAERLAAAARRVSSKLHLLDGGGRDGQTASGGAGS